MDRRLALLAIAACGRAGFDPVSTGDAGDAGTTSMCGNYQVARAPTFTNATPVFALVPGSELDISVPAGETWMVWVSAGLSSSDTSEETVETRLVIDGVARSTNQIQDEVANKPLPWFTFDLLAPGDHHVAVELRDAVAAATIENLHVVAFRAAVVASVESPGPTLLGTTAMDIVTLGGSIPAGDYLVVGATSMSEGPGTSGVTSDLRDPSGETWPVSSFSNHRLPFLSIAWIRRVTLPGGIAPFAITARSNTTSTVRDTRLAIISTNAATTYYAEEVSGVTALVPGALSVVALDVPALAQPRDRVIIQTFAPKGDTEPTRTNPVISELRRDGIATAHYEDWAVGTPVWPAGFVDAVTTSAAMRLENVLITADPSRGVAAREAVILALDLPCP